MWFIIFRCLYYQRQLTSKDINHLSYDWRGSIMRISGPIIVNQQNTVLTGIIMYSD